MTKALAVPILAGMVLAGCGPRERPVTTAYRQAADNLRIDNQILQQQIDISGRMLNITAMALVITGCGLAACLFVLRLTSGRR